MIEYLNAIDLFTGNNVKVILLSEHNFKDVLVLTGGVGDYSSNTMSLMNISGPTMAKIGDYLVKTHIGDFEPYDINTFVSQYEII